MKTNRPYMTSLLGVFMIVFSVIIACTQTQRSTMTGSFEACAKADLGALVKPGVTVFDDVVEKIKGNSPTLEADLTSLATTFGLSVIECSVAAIEAVLLAPAVGSGSGSDNGSAMVAMAKEPPPGLVRARVVIAQLKLASKESTK